MMNPTFLIYRNSNPTLINKLTDGQYHPIGDGLEIKMTISTDGPFLEFELRLEGKEIGSIDHEWGGCLDRNYPHGDGNEYDWDLHDKITDRMNELFPNIRDELGL